LRKDKPKIDPDNPLPLIINIPFDKRSSLKLPNITNNANNESVVWGITPRDGKPFPTYARISSDYQYMNFSIPKKEEWGESQNMIVSARWNST